MAKLFHVSEERGIARFEPRPPPSSDAGIRGDVVWAVDEAHLPNYLLPRNCPRVTFAASERTSSEDRARFLADSTAQRVIAVEADWLPRIKSCRLCLYTMPADEFEPADAIAGYWIARSPIVPVDMVEIADPLAEILKRDVEFRMVPDLWPLHDAVAASTLAFSLIRMRNARPRGSR